MSGENQDISSDSVLTRRTVLKSTSGLAGIPYIPKGNRFTESSDSPERIFPKSSQQNNNLIIDEFPSYPSQPSSIVTYGMPYFRPKKQGGWKSSTLREQIGIIHELETELIDPFGLVNFRNGRIFTSSMLSSMLNFSLYTGIPISDGWNVTIHTDDADSRYGDLMRSKSWTYPDGDPLNDPTEIAAQNFNTNLQWADTNRIVASVFASGTLDLLLHVAKQRLNEGFAGIWIDSSNIFHRYGLDFSTWARSSFQDHLESLSDDRLSELGIEEPSSFNVRDYLSKNDLEPESSSNPLEDPVFREFVLHKHLKINEFFETFRETIHENFPDRAENIGIFANQGINIKGYEGDVEAKLSFPLAPSIYTSDHFDHIKSENWEAVKSPTDIIYKLLKALSRFSKPVKIKSLLSEAENFERYEELDANERYPMLQRYQAAEAAANGLILGLPLTGPSNESADDDGITHWLRKDGTMEKELRTFSDFLWGHNRFLRDAQPENDVAVVLSLPDRIWRSLPQWDMGTLDDRPRMDSFYGTLQILREAQILYDVLVFGHPDLWNDTEQRDRLTEYDVVVLPAILCITDQQLSALRRFLDDDGKIVFSGNSPSRDGAYEQREDMESITSHENSIHLQDDPGRKRKTTGSSNGSLINTLEKNGISSPVIGNKSNLGVNRLTQSGHDRFIFHLLNYEYDRGTDTFTPRENIQIQLPKPEYDAKVARYYSPQKITDLSITDNGDSLEIEVPRLIEWGFVVIAASKAALANDTKREQATTNTDTAATKVEQARDSNNDWSPEFLTAEKKLETANVGLSYNAYEQANQAAQEAIEAVEQAYRQPVVGLVVKGSIQKSDYNPLQNTFDKFTYKLTSDLSSDNLGTVDVLIIPAGRRQQTYSENELNWLESFTAGGGSLVLVGNGNMETDMNSLAERFGYSFNGHRIVFPDEAFTGNKFPHAEVILERHQLTKGIPELNPVGGTAIQYYPEGATILAKIPEESSAWFHETAPEKERSDKEQSAAGAPVYATSSFGQGQITLLATNRYLFRPDANFTHHRITMRNLLMTSSRISVAGSSIGPVVNNKHPTDPDNDGIFEDLNGNRRLDVSDVQAFFANLDSDVLQSNIDAFDLNDNGRIDIVDVQTLFKEYLSR